MKKVLFFCNIVFFFSTQALAQRCNTFIYQQETVRNNIAITEHIKAANDFASQHLFSVTNNQLSKTENGVIKIPVIVHILYHSIDEKISDAQVQSQLFALNKAYRLRNADTVRIPAAFKPLAADCEIEFQLATSDIRGRSTNGIVRKYTPITKWTTNDQVKFSESMGDDAWDANSYLNIWVCNLDKLAGYSSLPGMDKSKDGIVIDFDAFGVINSANGYDMGKTAVHEIGHWLGLKHIWGDENCGDDGVGDTPKQASYTLGCPNSSRITCGNGPYGDMYMNYMDFTSDACMNLFTKGQKVRMQALFALGGPRNSLLSSKGLNPPLFIESPLPENDPKWLHPQLYPNPATEEINLDLSYDIRWIGKMIQVSNLQGQIIMQQQITSSIFRINVNKLPVGIYFLAAKKDNDVPIKLKFMKF